MSMSLNEACRRMMKLDKQNAPPFLKAHMLMRVLMPKAMRAIGSDHCLNHLSALISDTYVACHGICELCKKADSVSEGLCLKCSAEMDQFAAELESGSEG